MIRRLLVVAMLFGMTGCAEDMPLDDESIDSIGQAVEGEESPPSDDDQAELPAEGGSDVIAECQQECAETQKYQLEVCLVIFPGWNERTRECRDSVRARRRACGVECTGIPQGPDYPYCTLPLPGCPL